MSTHATDPSFLIESVIEAVSRWPGIEVRDHRYGGREFRLGDHEVGHVHYGGLVDVAYPRTIRDALVKAGRTGEDQGMTDSTWTSYTVRADADVRAATDLLRLAYLYHAFRLANHDVGRDALDGLDLDAELDGLDLPYDARSRVEQARQRAGY